MDPVDAPTMLALSQWMSEGRCFSRNLPHSLKRKPHAATDVFLKHLNNCVYC